MRVGNQRVQLECGWAGTELDRDAMEDEAIGFGVKRLIQVYQRGIIRLSHADRDFVNPTENPALIDRIIRQAVTLDLIERRQGEEGFQLTEKGRSIPPG